MKFLETMEENTQIEVEFPFMDISSNEGTITEVSGYHLTCDKARTEIIQSQKEDYACLCDIS